MRVGGTERPQRMDKVRRSACACSPKEQNTDTTKVTNEAHGGRRGGVAKILAGGVTPLELAMARAGCNARVVVVHDRGGRRVEGLHVNEREGPRTVEPHQDDVRPV